MTNETLELFYSYAPEDEPLLKELEKHLFFYALATGQLHFSETYKRFLVIGRQSPSGIIQMQHSPRSQALFVN